MIDVLDGNISVGEVLNMPLPDVLDLVKAKVRLEQAKTKAQKVAKELQAMNKSGG